MATVYEAAARFYDAFSGEGLVYSAGRQRGIALLGLRPGDTVLDLGCGTGLNFALLVDAVGPTGTVIGLDRSADMLQVARRRIEENGWASVRLIQADATSFDPALVTAALPTAAHGHVDAVFASYSLSVIGNWPPAWQRMRALLKPDGRAGIVDMQLPVGRARLFSPLARLFASLGGADLTKHPWTVLEREGVQVQTESVRGGHIRVVVATIPSPARPKDHR